jgi:head-tail adaptor
MSLEEKCNQPLELLRPEHVIGSAMGLVRKYVKERTVLAHVKTMSAAEIMRLRLTSVDISHNLWFAEDPVFDETYRLRWRDTIMRPAGPPVDLHGLGRVWLCTAKAITPDNENIEILD